LERQKKKAKTHIPSGGSLKIPNCWVQRAGQIAEKNRRLAKAESEEKQGEGEERELQRGKKGKEVNRHRTQALTEESSRGRKKK